MDVDQPNASEDDGIPSAVTPAAAATADLAELSATEIVGRYAADLMTVAAVKCGLYADAAEHRDLADARVLITALAGLVTASAPELGHHHAAPLRDGLRSLQLAFREASAFPDPPGRGPGESLTGPVYA